MDSRIPEETSGFLYGLTYRDLAAEIYAIYAENYPSVIASFSDSQRDHTIEDITFHIKYIHSALIFGTPGIFTEYALWIDTLFRGLNLPAEWIIASFQITRDVLLSHAPKQEGDRINLYIDQALTAIRSDQPDGHMRGSFSYVQTDLARAYLNAVLTHDRVLASDIIMDAVASKVPIKEIYLQVFQPVQFEIGRLWQTNQISVATEHYATAITQMIMGLLYPQIFSRRSTRGTLVAACVSGELHEIGLRMVADLFEMDGWDTRFIGANTPHHSVIQFLKENRPNIVALSTTISYHLPLMTRIIDGIRSEPALAEVKILVGGYPFRNNPELWRTMGADAMGLDAEDALKKAAELVPS